MLYDRVDIELLRLIAWQRNFPPGMEEAYPAPMLAQTELEPLKRQGLIRSNRRGTSLYLTPKGYRLLEYLGFSYTRDTRQPSREKLGRRLLAARTAFLFYRAGMEIFADSVADLKGQAVYLSASALRRKAASSATHLFGGSRFFGIARQNDTAMLVEYVDEGKMYFSAELRMFNNAIGPLGCSPALVFTGQSHQSIINELLRAKHPGEQKPARNDATNFAEALRRTGYPVYAVPGTDEGAVQLQVLGQKGYRTALAKFLLGKKYTPAPNGAEYDALLGAEPFMVLVDMDLKRLERVLKRIPDQACPALAIAALASQLNALEHWLESAGVQLDLFKVYESDLFILFPIRLAEPMPTAYHHRGEEEDDAATVRVT